MNGSINAIWVGRFLGEAALASTSNANLVMFLLMAFVFGFGMAATVLIGQAFGRGDVDGARRVIGTAIGGFLPITVLISALGWLAAPSLLHLLATPPDAMPLALAYLRVIFIAMPGLLMLIVLMSALRGGGDALTPLWFMILARRPRRRTQSGADPGPRPGAQARHRRLGDRDRDRQLHRADRAHRLHLPARPAAEAARRRAALSQARREDLPHHRRPRLSDGPRR